MLEPTNTCVAQQRANDEGLTASLQTYRSLKTNLATFVKFAVAKYWKSAFRHDTSPAPTFSSAVGSTSCISRKSSNLAASFDSGLVEVEGRNDDDGDDECREMPPEVVAVVANSCFFFALVATLPTPEEPSPSPVRDRLHPCLGLGLKKEVIIDC